MEPISMLCLGGAVAAVYAAHRSEKRELQKVLAGPKTLPQVLAAGDIGEHSLVRILAVHIRSVCMHSGGVSDGDRVSFVTKYGEKGDSCSCETIEAHATLGREAMEPAQGIVASFGASCLFLHQRSHPLVRIRLQKRGAFGRSVIAKADFNLPTLIPNQAAQEASVPLRKTRPLSKGFGEVIGHATVAISVHAVMKGEMQRCFQLLDAETTDTAVIANGSRSTPVVQGFVVPADSVSDVQRGVMIDEIVVAPQRAVTSTASSLEFDRIGTRLMQNRSLVTNARPTRRILSQSRAQSRGRAANWRIQQAQRRSTQRELQQRSVVRAHII